MLLRLALPVFSSCYRCGLRYMRFFRVVQLFVVFCHRWFGIAVIVSERWYRFCLIKFGGEVSFLLARCSPFCCFSHPSWACTEVSVFFWFSKRLQARSYCDLGPFWRIVRCHPLLLTIRFVSSTFQVKVLFSRKFNVNGLDGSIDWHYFGWFWSS